MSEKIPSHAKKVFSGVIFDVYQWKQKLYDGTIVTFEAVRRPWTGLIIPILDNGNILLGKEEQPWKWEYITFLGGRQDSWETLKETATRELTEETWYEAEEIKLLFSENPWGTKIDWDIKYYIAKWLKKVSKPKLDWGEKIEVFEVSLEDFLHLKFPYNCKIEEDIKRMVEELKNNRELQDKIKL